MDHADSARVARRDEPGHVADHSSPHGNEERAPVCARANKIAASLLTVEEFRGFAVIDQYRGAVRASSRSTRAPQVRHTRGDEIRKTAPSCAMRDTTRGNSPATRPGRLARRIFRSPPELKFSSCAFFAGVSRRLLLQPAKNVTQMADRQAGQRQFWHRF